MEDTQKVACDCRHLRTKPLAGTWRFIHVLIWRLSSSCGMLVAGNCEAMVLFKDALLSLSVNGYFEWFGPKVPDDTGQKYVFTHKTHSGRSGLTECQR